MSDAFQPETQTADTVTFDAQQSGQGSGRHRARKVFRNPATLVTAAITLGSVAVAGLAGGAVSDEERAEQLTASLDESALSTVAVDTARLTGSEAGVSRSSERLATGLAQANSVVIGAEAASATVKQAGEESERIAEEKAAKKEAAEKKAEEEAAAQARAEEEAAQERAEEEAAAQAAAEAEEEAAEQAQASAAEQSSSSNSDSSSSSSSSSGSSSSNSSAAETEEPAPVASVPAGSAKDIAAGMLSSYGWSSDQFSCLDSLWTKESGWNHTAKNPSSGAYGIPQSLPASKMASAGSDYLTNPATQISWGLGYINDRYGSPCAAWSHSQAVNWY